MESSLALPNLTCIDHAYLDYHGRVVGRSYHASFIITGKVDESDEKVVVDFSRIKKLIKAGIDSHDNGFDHKLWVSCKFLHKSETSLRIQSPHLDANLPYNAVKVFADDTHLDIDLSALVIAEHVKDYLLLEGISVNVTCFLDERPVFLGLPGTYNMFNYVHGLRDSSSYGCQNMLHGHTSYLHLVPADDCKDPVAVSYPPVRSDYVDTQASTLEILCTQICNELTDTVFVFSDNVLSTQEDRVAIHYTAKHRGTMFSRFVNQELQKVVVLETETTVEYLAEYISAMYGKPLKEAGAKAFILSEGLSKGCYFELTE